MKRFTYQEVVNFVNENSNCELLEKEYKKGMNRGRADGHQINTLFSGSCTRTEYYESGGEPSYGAAPAQSTDTASGTGARSKIV